MRRSRLLTLSLAFLVCAAPAAHADPVSIGTAILSWVAASAATASATIAAGITVAAAVGEAAILAVGVGISYVAQALRGNPQGAQPGSSGKMQASGITPRTWMAGYGMTGGKLAYVNTWGVSGKTPNAYLTMVIALSDLPCASLEGVIINDTPVTYGSGSPDADKGYAIPEYNKDSKDHLWVKFHDGTQAAADSFLTSTFGSDPNYPYATSRKGIGIAYAIVTALVEPTLFSGFPTCKFILNGAKLYDPRLDTSVGGDGSHRFDDQSTWEFTSNPKVIEYNVLRGITYGGRWFYGLQNLTAARLPTSSWFAAMNECDLDVDNSADSTEPQYRCGGEIAVNVPPVNAIEELNKSCNGRLAEIGGIYKTHVGAAGTPSFSFTDADLLSTEGQTFDQFPSLSDLINAVTASFPDPTQGWEMTPAPGRYSSDFETADGGRQLVSDVQYNMVPFPEQVQRLQKAALAEARNFRKHTIPLPPNFWFVEPLDFASWTSTRNGYDTKTFRFDLVTDLASLDLVAIITETDPADYDWTPDDDYIPYVSGPLVIQRPASQAMVGWSVEAETINGAGGRAKAGIRINWGTTDITDVDGVVIQIRRASDSAVVWSGETPHSVEQFLLGTFVTSENLSSATDYEVRGQYRPISARDVTWSSWLAVTTDDVRVGSLDIYDDAIERAHLDAALKNFHDFIGPQVADLKNKLRTLSQLAAEIDLGTAYDVQQLRRQLVAVSGANRAEFNETITAATGPSSAIVQRLDALDASLDDKASASAVDALTTRVDDNEGDISTLSSQYTSLSGTVDGKADSSVVSALSSRVDTAEGNITSNADALTALDTTVDRFSASGIFRVSVATTLSGADATAAIGVSATDSGTTYTAGIYLNARTADAKTEVLLVGSQIGLMNDSGTVFALFTDSGAYLNTAIIKDATIGTLHLENGAVSDPQTPVFVNGSTGSVTGGNADISTAVTASHTYDATGYVEIGYSGACAFGSSYTGWQGTIVCIRSDGTQLPGTIALYSQNYSGASGVGGGIAGKWFDTSPINTAGVTYKLQFQTIAGHGPAGSATLTLTGYLTAVQFKK